MNSDSGRTRVAVIYGGRSPEHSISCVSAGSVLAALDPDEFEAVPVGITPEGRWVSTPGDPAELVIRDGVLPVVADGPPVIFPGDPTQRGLLIDGALSPVDVVFPVLHGAYGEDGAIQGLLDMAAIPYVGAGVFASSAGMDKEYSKKLFAAAGLPIVPYAMVRAGETLSPEDQQRIGLPAFVKPARAGSSIGITKISSWSEWEAALAAAREHDTKVLVEPAVAGVREVECAVLEAETGGSPEASLPAEIRVVSGHDWYDFAAKYLDDACEFDLPAVLADDVTARIRRMAGEAFTAIEGAGLARVDFFVTPSGEIYLNEINTMPGFTSISLFPRMWAATGLDYPKLVSRLIRTAIATRS